MCARASRACGEVEMWMDAGGGRGAKRLVKECATFEACTPFSFKDKIKNRQLVMSLFRFQITNCRI
jgi:hypothetical protein